MKPIPDGPARYSADLEYRVLCTGQAGDFLVEVGLPVHTFHGRSRRLANHLSEDLDERLSLDGIESARQLREAVRGAMEDGPYLNFCIKVYDQTSASRNAISHFPQVSP
jgi:hypothetical protein